MIVFNVVINITSLHSMRRKEEARKRGEGIWDESNDEAKNQANFFFSWLVGLVNFEGFRLVNCAPLVAVPTVPNCLG